MSTVEKDLEARELAFADDVPQQSVPQEADALTSLEDRIQKLVSLVGRLRAEKEAAVAELRSTQSALAAAEASLEDTKSGTSRLSHEVTELRAERQQVRNRLEKLLGHIDQLGAA
jgi:chromosome segregation ATPase